MLIKYLISIGITLEPNSLSEILTYRDLTVEHLELLVEFDVDFGLVGQLNKYTVLLSNLGDRGIDQSILMNYLVQRLPLTIKPTHYQCSPIGQIRLIQKPVPAIIPPFYLDQIIYHVIVPAKKVTSQGITTTKLYTYSQAHPENTILTQMLGDNHMTNTYWYSVLEHSYDYVIKHDIGILRNIIDGSNTIDNNIIAFLAIIDKRYDIVDMLIDCASTASCAGGASIFSASSTSASASTIMNAMSERC